MTTPPMARPRVASGALFFDHAGRVLLVKPTYKPGWEIPGGYVEPDETPGQACEREVEEELGLKRQVGRPLVVDWAPTDKEGDKVLFVFDGGVLTEADCASIRLAADELEEFAFYSFDQIDALLVDRLARRVHAAASARRRGELAYLEHGTPTTTGSTEWWTTDDVAAYLQVSPSTVRAYMARQQMPEPDRRIGHLPVWQPATIRTWNHRRPRKSSPDAERGR